MSIPEEHLVDSQSLTGDGIVHMFEITLNDKTTILRFSPNPTFVWDSKTWEQRGIAVTGERRTGSDEEIKPRLQVQQEDGQFNVFIQNGIVENSIVTRYLAMREHIDQDIVLFVKRSWYISRIAEHTKELIGCELRSLHEGPKISVPARIFAPPEFPLVRIQ